MTDCGCDKAKAELEEFLHHELRAPDAADVAEHLANCVDCTHEHAVGVVLTAAVKRACSETAPEELRAEVLLKIRELRAAM
ncbi:zf-HC2 domain-containing protein [Galbitalea sp. SE-J8]|uniref:zf-HC2 domain-containing protein n=1 Tax=Galbitalea sp. SE-J8 TaxID=3054952 RepID=UPI00259C6C89|nr:zf-HC2 domain-containing protein [Galbitalea sp. SE-J8]MDM4764139.1 zf-HC2 domain-containing protein [Galbitalea sp. SE-J8]